MENQELLTYIKDAIDLETDLVSQERILTQCCTEIQTRKPPLQLMEQPELNLKPTVPFGAGMWLLSIIGIAIIILSFSIGQPGLLLFPVGGFLALPPLLVIIVNSINHEENEHRRIEHEKAVKRVNHHNEEAHNRHNAITSECDASELALRQSAEPHIAETRALLEKLYDKGIIYRKYCTLPALTSIYEYFMTGRCTELTGPNGAYNLYESEVRADTIISQLNTVIENLEKIRQNQYMLYQQVTAIQTNTARIASELHQIKGYTVQIAELTALNAYYASLNERNTRITMYYHL